MAIHAPITGALSCATVVSDYPADFWRTLVNLDRLRLEGVIEMAISLLDADDGDPDLEPNGDELDGTGGEDDFCNHSAYMSGPGCPIADPDVGIDDVPRDREAPLRPKYGIDQSAGPINEVQAAREWQEAQRRRYAIG
ncbi:hypothetical protein G432_09290 [Sphingomonas sp. MM-1]|uniref:hypothetical protein n=1 Tax=Sphingomonas sp. MM-1 TaxID=745310 RepID=UPI0002C057D6|nr:hypothetical protein [Sphingomonas sp. MM-1]AGH49583.1 hypothetical protein G432_09290 [Sphingomonas sp. MM-1]